MEGQGTSLPDQASSRNEDTEHESHQSNASFSRPNSANGSASLGRLQLSPQPLANAPSNRMHLSLAQLHFPPHTSHGPGTTCPSLSLLRPPPPGSRSSHDILREFFARSDDAASPSFTTLLHRPSPPIRVSTPQTPQNYAVRTPEHLGSSDQSNTSPHRLVSGSEAANSTSHELRRGSASSGFLENIPTHPSSHVSLHHRDDNSRRPVEQHPSPSRRSQTLRGVGSSEPRMADKGRTLSETGHPLQILRTSRLHAPYSQTSYRSLSQSRDKLRNLPPRSNTIPGPNEDRQPSSFAHLMSSDMPSSQSRSLPSDRGHLSSDTSRLIDHRGRNDPFEVVRFQHPPQSHQSINELSHPAPLFERMERGNLHSSDLTRRHSLEGTPIASTSTAPDIGAAPYRRFTKNFGPMIEPLRCRNCNRKCKSEASFQKHNSMCTHRAGPLTLECKYCKRPYTYVGYLQKHENECAKTLPEKRVIWRLD